MTALAAGEVSVTAGKVDAVFFFILGIALFFFLLTQGLLIAFAIRYRRRKGEEERETPSITGNRLLEFVWILVPTIVVMAIFAYGYVVFRDIRAERPGTAEIGVTARQFLYEFRYPDGRTAINEVRVPVGRPVRVVMTSADVIHGFYLPDFRVKQDVVPGQYTTLEIAPEKAGRYVIFCTQYCGTGHSTMQGALVVMPAAEYAAWAAAVPGPSAKPVAERGEEIRERSGCLGCHALSGPVKVGPDLGGIFGRTVELEGGATVTADENYLRESIYDPGAKIVKGFPNVMPTFKATLSEDDVAAIIAYLKTTAGGGGRPERGGGRGEK